MVEQDEKVFEIHRLENIEIVSGKPLVNEDFIYSKLILSGDSESGSRNEDFVSKIRIVCPSVEDKNSWVSTINLEIRQLNNLAKSLCFK